MLSRCAEGRGVLATMGRTLECFFSLLSFFGSLVEPAPNDPCLFFPALFPAFNALFSLSLSLPPPPFF